MLALKIVAYVLGALLLWVAGAVWHVVERKQNRILWPKVSVLDRLLWESAVQALKGPPSDSEKFARAIGGRLIAPGNIPRWALTMARTHRVIFRETDRDAVLIAPWWLAWFYAWLPMYVAVNRGPEFDKVQQGPFYLWCLYARRWSIGWLPARRQPAYKARLGIMALGDRRVAL